MNRILIHSQHLGGTGHFVRMYEIASALAPDHEVHLVDSGRPVPRRRAAGPIHLLELPRLRRTADGVMVPLDGEGTLEEVLGERRRVLRAAVERIEPDVMVVEHFPFSKAVLAAEILPAIEAARKRGAKIICSIRDFSPVNRHDPKSGSHVQFVLRTLETHFDYLLIHGDPRVVRLDEQLAWTAAISVQIMYTGYVSQRPEAVVEKNGVGLVVASAGGTGCRPLLPVVVKAWEQLMARGADGGRKLMVFLPLELDEATRREMEASAVPGRLEVLGYRTDFVTWMQRSELSISNSGYNTCTNMLETRKPGILVANTHMTDQLPRANRLAAMGLAAAIPPEELTAERMAAEIVRQLSAAVPPPHDINLEGAARTRQFVVGLLGKVGVSDEVRGMVDGPVISE